MPIWKITPEGPEKVPDTKLHHEDLLERHLEDWIIADPSLLGEPLLVIGQQVTIPDVRDRVDILALDPEGNTVVVELKRGRLKDPVDIQALRYASYLSRWRFEDFESQARTYLKEAEDADFNFNELYERFCSDAGVDDVPDINSDQRMILVGAEVRDKLGSVALWLREHNVDIKVIEVEVYREGETLLVEPEVIIPLPVSRFGDIGRVPGGEVVQPWRADGRGWHLNKRCSAKTKEMLLELDDLIRDNFEVDGPRWNQKFYVAYRVRNYIWVAILTHASILRLDVLVQSGTFERSALARRLGVEEFDREGSISEKLSLPSSVLIQRVSEDTERVVLRIKEDFDLQSPSFLEFLQQANEKFPK
jgi:hypothetical protein